MTSRWQHLSTSVLMVVLAHLPRARVDSSPTAQKKVPKTMAREQRRSRRNANRAEAIARNGVVLEADRRWGGMVALAENRIALSQANQAVRRDGGEVAGGGECLLNPTV